MHSDLRTRDSLACDLMEAIRPQADEFVLELIKNREFRKNDFFETREGICRILPPLSPEITQSAMKWRKSIRPIVEEVAQTLFKSARSNILVEKFLITGRILFRPNQKNNCPPH
jgi:hypothetical protein